MVKPFQLSTSTNRTQHARKQTLTCPLPTTTKTLFLKVGYLLDLNKNFRPNTKHKTPDKTMKLLIIIKKKRK